MLRQLAGLTHEEMTDALHEMIVKSVDQMRGTARWGALADSLLRRLVVFRGAFDRAAVTAVTAVKPTATYTEDMLDDALADLRGWRFVRYDAADRCTVDEVTIGAVPVWDEPTRAAHFAHYFTLHGDHEANGDEDRHAAILADWPNVRAALAWGLEHRTADAVRFTIALAYPMKFHHSLAEQQAVLEAAHAAAVRSSDTWGEAATLQALGDVERMQNSYDAARARYTAALALGEAIGDFAVRFNSFEGLSKLEITLNNPSAACAFMRLCIQLMDTHPFYRDHTETQAMRVQYAALGCG